MPPLARRLDSRTLRAAALTDGGVAVPLDFLTAGTLTWPWQRAHEVLHEWRRRIGAARAVVGSTARLLRPPGGRPVVAVELALADGPHGSAIVAALRRLGPDVDTVRLGPPVALRPPVDLVPRGMDPISAHLRLTALPAEAVDAFVAIAGPASGSELLSAELHRVGGAYAVVATGAAGDRDQAERVRIGLEHLRRRLAPWAAGG